jgi:MinD superfamily P-loop ATPase
MVITVASGKGGTGKTTFAVNLALSMAASERVQFVDCDVEAPNAHLFLKPSIDRYRDVTLPVPEVDGERCTRCELCAERCAFNALAVLGEQVLIYRELCHGCGGCARFCPEQAITEVPRRVGEVVVGSAYGMDFVQGQLDIGQPLSPPVIRAAKQEITDGRLVIIDAAPGTACPMVEALRGSDFCLLVTEPTPFGHNDLALAVEVTRQLGVPAAVVLNRSDLGDGRAIAGLCRQYGLTLLMRTPYDRRLAQLHAGGTPAVQVLPAWKERFAQLGHRLLAHAGQRQGAGPCTS